MEGFQMPQMPVEIAAAISNSPVISPTVAPQAGASQGATYEPVKSTNWVECDECETWRLLPATVDMEAIGKWKW